ncbi:M23 family metallopeptidase [Brachybacterium sp. GPGPB12]|uniref:M23 family metallopeptidase n=1 Tax=Brachybacterium sp. GPGPB12 TaxID=3023517 RepID=UPI003134278D
MVGAAGSGEAPDDGADVPAGTVAVLAHLRRGSPTVRAGERVRAGQVLGQCGNSGNSSDPHVHVQLMDGPDITTAKGVPFTWRYLDEEGAVRTGVPANEELFTAVAEGAAR